MAVESKGSVIVDGQTVPMVPLGTEDIADSAITAAKMGANAVATATILDANVTVGKLDPTLLAYFLPFCLIDVGEIDYSLIQ